MALKQIFAALVTLRLVMSWPGPGYRLPSESEPKQCHCARTQSQAAGGLTRTHWLALCLWLSPPGGGAGSGRDSPSRRARGAAQVPSHESEARSRSAWQVQPGRFSHRARPWPRRPGPPAGGASD